MLLALGGSLLFATTSLFFVQAVIRSHANTDTLPASLAHASSFDIGQYYFNQKGNPTGPYDLKKAQHYYEKAIGEDPKGNNALWYQSGRIDFINGNFDRALQKFNRQVEYFGDQVPNVYYMLGLTYGYKARISNDPNDWAMAEKNFDTSLEYFYDAPWTYVDLSWLYFSQGKFQEMKPLLEKGLSYHSNNPWLLNMYGLALLNTGDKAMSKEYFSFAIELTNKMSVEQWGKSYPGNDPRRWNEGLSEFKGMLNKNLALAEQ